MTRSSWLNEPLLLDAFDAGIVVRPVNVGLSTRSRERWLTRLRKAWRRRPPRPPSPDAVFFWKPNPLAIHEPTDPSYARVAWDDAPGPNRERVAFPRASEDWGRIEAVVLWDAPTGGRLVAWWLMASPVRVDAGHMAVFDAGALDGRVT